MAFIFHATMSNPFTQSPWILTSVKAKDTEDIEKGAMLNIESGEVDIAATGNSGLVGACVETVSAVDSTTPVKFVANFDAIYRVGDANARNIGAKFDLDSDATGITTSTNADLVMVVPTLASEDSLVCISPSQHFWGGA